MKIISKDSEKKELKEEEEGLKGRTHLNVDRCRWLERCGERSRTILSANQRDFQYGYNMREFWGMPSASILDMASTVVGGENSSQRQLSLISILPMKKKLRFILLVLLLVISGTFLFRGFLYRSLVQYKVVSDRPAYIATDDELKKIIGSASDKTSIYNIDDVIRISHRLTSQTLQFRFAGVENDPNIILHAQKANCIGYSAFFSTVANALLEKNQLASDWSVGAFIGHLYFLGFNIHQYTDHPYFVDHDFVVLENKKTGESIAVDPSLYDYSGICVVRKRN